MKSFSILTLLLYALPAQAIIQGGGFQDFGTRLSKASNAAVGNQFLAFPLPMHNVLKGKWQLGVDGGYSAVEAGVVNMKGGMASVGFTYGFADHWGVYGMAYGNSQSLSGGGREVLIHPFANNVPLDTPEHSEHTNVRGTAKMLGAGAALVWDPLVSSEESHSMPVYAGLVINRFSLDDALVDYQLVTGANAGQRGTMDFSGDYTFPMLILGWQYSRNIGKFKIAPNVLVAPPIADVAQKGTITGTTPLTFTRSGDTEAIGNSDANFNFFIVAVGTTLLYRPWGLGANLGATLFRAVTGPSLYDGVDKVFQIDLSWRWGNYAR